ncbi:MAG: argininosuccinate lyase, partial [Deltaproteobacteria bacterium]|nr:argininosuccinate lyase [Deltaproteobacteria bacterium]
HLISLLTTMKGLPLTYNKDMQEDKESLFDAVDTVEICLDVMCRLLGEVTFDGKRLKDATEKGFLVATDLADYLVREGRTFREAHEIVGKMVLFSVDQGKELHDLTLAEMRRFEKKINKEVYTWLDPALTVKRRNIPGGTGPDMVKQSLKKAREELKS